MQSPSLNKSTRKLGLVENSTKLPTTTRPNSTSCPKWKVSVDRLIWKGQHRGKWNDGAKSRGKDWTTSCASFPALPLALCVPWGVTACYVHTIPDIFCAGARTIPDRASVHTHQWGFQREVAPGRCRRWSVGISNGFCVRLWCGVKQVFRPSRKWISRKEDWSPLKRKQIFMSKEWN